MKYQIKHISDLYTAKRTAYLISIENPKQFVIVTKEHSRTYSEKGFKVSIVKKVPPIALTAYKNGDYTPYRSPYVNENPLDESVLPLAVAFAGLVTIGVSVYLTTKDKTGNLGMKSELPGR